MPERRSTQSGSTDRSQRSDWVVRVGLPVVATALVMAGVAGDDPHPSSAEAVQERLSAGSVEPAPPAGGQELLPAQQMELASLAHEWQPSSAQPPDPPESHALPVPLASDRDDDDATEHLRLLRAAAARRQAHDAAARAAKIAAARQPAGGTPLPRRQLSHEQLNAARFISAKYRVAVDASSEFVYHAFRTARDMKVDPFLILAVMSVESSFNPLAHSSKGAQGLMQVLTRVHAERFLQFGGITAAFDPVANIRVGSAILKEYLDREGSVEGALKSYVGAALLAHDGGYGAKVLSERERIAAAAAGLPPSGDAASRAGTAPEMHRVSAAAAAAANDGAVAQREPSQSHARSASAHPLDVSELDLQRAGYPGAKAVNGI
jgi:hypothetical protein